MKPEQERIRCLLADAICLLCRNGLQFENELRVQAVVGITVDKEECFVVHLNKCYERQEEESCDEDANDATAKEPEPQNAVSSATVLQPTRDAPPCPVDECSKPSASQDLSTCNGDQSKSNLTQSECVSKSDVHTTGSSKRKLVDECEELNARGKMRNGPVYVESDECDDSSVSTADSTLCGGMPARQQAAMHQPQYYKSSHPPKRKHRHSVDAYRQKAKKRNLCDDLLEAEDDYCDGFNAGQQYMYIDVGKRAKPKAMKQQDVCFDPCYRPNMMAHGSPDVRWL